MCILGYLGRVHHFLCDWTFPSKVLWIWVIQLLRHCKYDVNLCGEMYVFPRPRPPLPLSATLTEDEAAAIIQAHYRGYRIRSTHAHVVEFRKWQKRYSEEKNAVRKIQQWWRNVLRLRCVVAQVSAHVAPASSEGEREGERQQQDQ